MILQIIWESVFQRSSWAGSFILEPSNSATFYVTQTEIVWLADINRTHDI